MSVSASTVVRGDLLKLLEQELLGPRNGPEEEIKGTPRAAYAVGGLAPVTIDPTKLVLEIRADDGADPNDTGLAVSDIDPTTAGQRGVPVNTDEEPGTADEDEAPDEGPKGALTHPSSMGIRFQVPNDCGLLVVTATWGRYESFRKENEDGRKFQWSRRKPAEKPVKIDVRDVVIHTTLDPIQLGDDVSLRVEFFPNPRTDPDRVIIELALSNDRETRLDAPPGDWLFQTKLHVEAISGEAVFLPTRDVLLDSYDEPDDERRRLDLQYRHRLEFAVGRTCSATWTDDDNSRRASSVSTTWLPTADIPQTIAGSSGDAIISMRELAALDADQATSAFAPLVDGYNSWLTTRLSSPRSCRHI